MLEYRPIITEEVWDILDPRIRQRLTDMGKHRADVNLIRELTRQNKSNAKKSRQIKRLRARIAELEARNQKHNEKVKKHILNPDKELVIDKEAAERVIKNGWKDYISPSTSTNKPPTRLIDINEGRQTVKLPSHIDVEERERHLDKILGGLLEAVGQMREIVGLPTTELVLGNNVAYRVRHEAGVRPSIRNHVRLGDGSYFWGVFRGMKLWSGPNDPGQEERATG